MSSEHQKEVLKREVQKNQETAAELVEISRCSLVEAQGILDLAKATRECLEHNLPSDFDIKRATEEWNQLGDQQSQYLAARKSHPHPPGIMGKGSAGSAVARLASADTFVSFQPVGRRDDARRAAVHLGHVLDRSREAVPMLLRQLHLDVPAAGKQSPTALFNTAWDVYEKPASSLSSSSSSLLPIRDCINEVLEILLRRCPGQEPAGSQHAKVISIGKRAAYSSIPPSTIESLASQWSEGKNGLVTDLSESKVKSISREEWLRILRQATLFLSDLLQLIDPAKLR